MPPVISAIKNSSNVLVQKSNPVGLLPNRISNFLWPVKDNLCKHRGYTAFCTKEPWYTCEQPDPPQRSASKCSTDTCVYYLEKSVMNEHSTNMGQSPYPSK